MIVKSIKSILFIPLALLSIIMALIILLFLFIGGLFQFMFDLMKNILYLISKMSDGFDFIWNGIVSDIKEFDFKDCIECILRRK